MPTWMDWFAAAFDVTEDMSAAAAYADRMTAFLDHIPFNDNEAVEPPCDVEAGNG